jgi:hypothetical protein
MLRRLYAAPKEIVARIKEAVIFVDRLRETDQSSP